MSDGHGVGSGFLLAKSTASSAMMIPAAAIPMSTLVLRR